MDEAHVRFQFRIPRFRRHRCPEPDHIEPAPVGIGGHEFDRPVGATALEQGVKVELRAVDAALHAGMVDEIRDALQPVRPDQIESDSEHVRVESGMAALRIVDEELLLRVEQPFVECQLHLCGEGGEFGAVRFFPEITGQFGQTVERPVDEGVRHGVVRPEFIVVAAGLRPVDDDPHRELRHKAVPQQPVEAAFGRQPPVNLFEQGAVTRMHEILVDDRRHEKPPFTRPGIVVHLVEDRAPRHAGAGFDRKVGQHIDVGIRLVSHAFTARTILINVERRILD